MAHARRVFSLEDRHRFILIEADLDVAETLAAKKLETDSIPEHMYL